MFIRIFFFFFLVVLSPVQAASISFDIPLSISVEAGREGRLNFTNKDGVGNYQMHVTGRPSWLTIHNNNDQYRSGYLKMKPQVDDIGDYQMVIWSCQKGSHSICSDKKTVSIRVSGSAEPLNVSIGNFSWVEYTASTQPFSVSGGAPPYSATISGRFSNRDRPFPLMPDQKLTCDNSSTCLPPLVNNDRKFNFTLTIKDSQGATASDSFVITVTNDPKKDAPSSPILRTATVDNSKGKIGLSWTSSTNSPNWYLVTFIGNGKTATKRPSPETGQNLELFETIDLLKRGVEYSVYAQAHNTKGYSKRSNTIKFTLKTKTNQKPTIRCINCPQTGKVNTPLGFTFKTIEPDAEKVINTIKWGDGKKYTSANQNQSEFSLNHRYTSKGTFTIRATAQDSNHNKSTVYTHNIVISQDDTPTNPELPDTFKTSFLLGNPNNHAPATQSAGFGVNAVTGNFHYSDHDASMAGKDIDFSFIRAYNSMVDGKDSFGDAITEPLGRGWTHSYHIQLRFKGQQAEVIWGDGSRDGFIKSGATWLAVTPNNRYQLQAQGNGWLLTTRKKTGYYFDGTGKLSKIESRHKNTLQLTYNGKNLTAITDTAGRKISFAYTGNKLKTISLPLGRTVRYDYTVNGLLKAVTDRRGNVWRYVYQNDRLRVIYQANASENNLDIKKQLQIKYDAQGRVEQQDTGYTASNNSVGHYRFTWGTQTMSFNSPTGQGARYQWDKNYRLTKVTPVNAASGTVPTLQAYSKDGIYALLPDYQKDNKGHKTTLNFGGTGSSDNFDLTKITDPANRQSSLSYTSQHDLKTLTTPTGLQTAIDWKNNSPTRISVSGNNQSTINTQLTHENGLLKRLERGNKTLEITEHNIDGQPKKIVTKDSTGVLVTEQRAYDNAGRLISTQRSLGNTFTCLAYDANDNIDHIISGVSSCSGNLGSVKATASIGHVYLQYDDNNRLIKRTTAYKSAKAQSTTYAYNDKTGKVSRSCHLASTNEKRCKSYQYDKDLRLYEVKTETTGRIDRIHTLQSGALRTVNENAKDTARRITRKAYDPNGNLKSISSCRDMESNNAQADCKSDQKRVQISYDKLDRPTGINVFLDKNKKRYTGIAYSQGGRITTLTEANGNKMRRETDSLGRLIKVTQSKGSESFSSEYAYDDNNNLTKITDPSKLVTTFRYDGLGRRLSRSDLKGTETWAYSKDGLTTTYKAPDGNGITYSHDPAGNLIQLKSSDKFSVNYSYNALGQKTTVNWSGYGRSGQRRYDYTAFGELKTVDSATGKTSYRYDSAGRMKTKQYAGLNIAYGYNGLNQLTQLTGDAGKFTFNHDAFTGALQRQVFPNGVETSYQRNLAGELLGINTQKGSNKILNYALTLDQNGRRKTIQAEQPQGIQQTAENLQFTFTLKGIIDQLNGKKVTYDQRGNITNIPAPFDHAYGYDGLDRVTSSNGIQHQYDDSRRRIAKIKDGKTTNYQWDTSTPFDDVIAEYDAKTLKKRYLYGAGGLLAQIDADGTAHYVHQDFNHNVVALSNASGSVSDSFAFSPYGRSAGRTGTTDIPFGFAGGVGVMTDSPDNIYMRARHYHTGLRQFTSPDLIEGNLLRPQSLNRYAYIEGMALSGVDASGYYITISHELRGATVGSYREKSTTYILPISEWENIYSPKYVTAIEHAFGAGMTVGGDGMWAIGTASKLPKDEKFINVNIEFSASEIGKAGIGATVKVPYKQKDGSISTSFKANSVVGGAIQDLDNFELTIGGGAGVFFPNAEFVVQKTKKGEITAVSDAVNNISNLSDGVSNYFSNALKPYVCGLRDSRYSCFGFYAR